MELIKKCTSDEYMTESEARRFQMRVGTVANALKAGKSIEEIAEILKTNVETAEEYVKLCRYAESRRGK